MRHLTIECSTIDGISVRSGEQASPLVVTRVRLETDAISELKITAHSKLTVHWQVGWIRESSIGGHFNPITVASGNASAIIVPEFDCTVAE